MKTAPDAAYIFLELDKWRWTTETGDPADCWLFVRDNTLLDRLPWSKVFLLSLDESDGASNSLAGDLLKKKQATPLRQAALFLNQLEQGTISRGTVQRAFSHLRLSEEVERGAVFIREQCIFSRQFSEPEPKTGLSGFLRKERYAFSSSLKTNRERSCRPEWLDL